MNAEGQSFLRKALRLFSAGVPITTLASDELFCVLPGAAVPMVMAYGPMGDEECREDKKPYRMEDGGIAVISVTGLLSEHLSLYRMFGCSNQPTLGELRRAVLQAETDPDVAGVMLYLQTPGGTHAGTPQLAEAVAQLAKSKPVHAFAENICASAGYWPASQAHRLTAHRASEIGGVGVFSILVDASKAAAAQGLKFHVISTGPFKGAAAEPGAGLTPEQLEYFQGRANDAGEIFFGDVSAGRGISLDRVRELADGRVHIAARAVSLGLIDAIGTYAGALEALAAAIKSPPAQRTAAPPSPPEPVPEEEPPLPEQPGVEEKAMSKELKAQVEPDEDGNCEEGYEKGDDGMCHLMKKEEAQASTVLGKIRALLGGSPKEVTAPSEPQRAAAPPAPGLTVEQVEERIKAGVKAEIEARTQAQEVDADLKALAGRVPPAILNDADTRTMLLEAKSKGQEAYQKRLALVAGNDASRLLGGWMADERSAGESLARSEEAEMLARNGIDEKRAAELSRRYGLNSGPVIN